MPGHKPSFVSTSLVHPPQACTLIRTCPAPGSGISRSTILKSPPGLEICATVIGAASGFTATLRVAIEPPMNSVLCCDEEHSCLDSKPDCPLYRFRIGAEVLRARLPQTAVKRSIRIRASLQRYRSCFKIRRAFRRRSSQHGYCNTDFHPYSESYGRQCRRGWKCVREN